VKLEFDGHQDYQLEAIQAVIDIFEGQPLAKMPVKFKVNFTLTDKSISSIPTVWCLAKRHKWMSVV
jgi:hypothetical protein